MSDSIRQFKLWYGIQPKALRLLISINVIAYLMWQLVFIHFQGSNVFFLTKLALNADLPSILTHPWQLLTYAFLHLEPGLGGLLHILFNMLWLLWIGREYEAIFGSQRIIGIYVLGAVGAALVTVGLHALLPGVASFGGIVHGASGAVLALMTMVAIHQPEKRIGLMFIGVVRLIHVVIGFIALDFLFLSAGGTSVSAHWGGVLTGFICGKMLLQGMDPAGSLGRGLMFGGGRAHSGGAHRDGPAHSGSTRGGSTRGGVSTRGGASTLHRMENWLASRQKKSGATIYHMDHTARTEKTSETDINDILDKISSKGYDSLTKEEKERLLKESDS